MDRTKYQSVVTEQGTINYTGFAMALDVAMACDESAMARYREIWGQDWTPLYETVEEPKIVRSPTNATDVTGGCY